MIREIAIYVEGGGEGEVRELFRSGMSNFLKPVREMARKKRLGFKVVACGGRSEAYTMFVNALRDRQNRHCILLVDSEEAIENDRSPWAHLRNRQRDGWERPEGATDEQCQMMVVCMEAWFLADPDTLSKYFDSRFTMPSAGQSEKMSKDQLQRALKNIAKNTPKKEYIKGRDGAKLLEKIDPGKVRTHCKWCDRLFTTLEDLINTAS